MREIKIYATDKKTGERIQIDDLYWFEENGVHWFDGKGTFTDYQIELSLELVVKLIGDI
jgi:hypothetical protein